MPIKTRYTSTNDERSRPQHPLDNKIPRIFLYPSEDHKPAFVQLGKHSSICSKTQRNAVECFMFAVWKEHAKTYLDDIVPTITEAPKSIHKVRAGYILNEVLRIDSPEIQSWQRFSGRGGKPCP